MTTGMHLAPSGVGNVHTIGETELTPGWFRIVPCGPTSCGEHGWHVDYARGIDPDVGPTGPHPGVFLGVWQ